MGLALPVLKLLIAQHARKRFTPPVLTLGAQSIGSTNRALLDLLVRHDLITELTAQQILQKINADETADAASLFEWMGLGYTQSLDLFDAEGASIIHDLAQPVPDALTRRFGLIIDGGTLEHVFDIAAALRNTIALLKPGGTVIHISPVSGWDNHAFYSLSPKLLARIYALNTDAHITATLIHLDRTDNTLSTGRIVELDTDALDQPFNTDSKNEYTLLYFQATCNEIAQQPEAPIDTHQPVKHTSSAPKRTAPLLRDDLLYWHRDNEFNDLLTRASLDCGQGPRDRYFVLKELLMSLGSLEADTAECGVYQGLGSRIMLHYANQLPRHEQFHHHIFDSFQGMSRPTSADTPQPGVRPWQKGDMTANRESVLANLKNDPAIVTHPGWIPDCFSDVASDQRFAFVHIDVDLYEPTRDALHFFAPRLIPGGIILLDDDGFLTCPGARKAVNEFKAQAPNHRITRLPTGQAFTINIQ